MRIGVDNGSMADFSIYRGGYLVIILNILTINIAATVVNNAKSCYYHHGCYITYYYKGSSYMKMHRTYTSLHMALCSPHSYRSLT